MAAIAAPVASRLRQGDRLPLLVAVSYPPSSRADWLIGRAEVRKAIALAPKESVRLGPSLPKLETEVLCIGIGPGYASLQVAKRFWTRSRQVVAAPEDDLEAILAGSSLASSLAVPLVIREKQASQTLWSGILGDLGVAEVLLAVSSAERVPAWATNGSPRTTVLAVEEIQRQVIARLGAENVRTIVLVRTPDPSTCVGQTAWLAPYWGLARGAPVAFTRNASAASAEAAVAELIERHGLHPRSALRPRSVTILADYISIRSELAEVPEGAIPEGESPLFASRKQGSSSGAASEGGSADGTPTAVVAPSAPKYQVKIEPFIPRQSREAVAVGVGRVPLESLADVSVLFARGMVRERGLADRSGRVLLVANASLDRRPLPLCETISRVTGLEFKNFSVPLDEFYGKLADSPEILAAAEHASFIIYEGHAGYQDLIFVPYGHSYVPDSYYEEALDALENRTPDPAAQQQQEATAPAPPSVPPPLPTPPGKPNRIDRPLAELPVVVLQSCDSLDERLLDRIDELGCTAVIGSMTPIHSGSGSMLMQALAEAVLYRGATVGEALRDAQNYLLCLGDLKIQRGLKEQAKSRRVAWSFRLWGDPELRILPPEVKRPRTAPVSAEWTGPDQLTIRTPAKRYPQVASKLYTARMFPGSQSAGLVKKQNGDALRRVLPAYYFRVALPEGFPKEGARLELSNGGANQAVFRLDPLGRFLYVVYLPEVERPNEAVVLRWVAAGLPSR